MPGENANERISSPSGSKNPILLLPPITIIKVDVDQPPFEMRDETFSQNAHEARKDDQIWIALINHFDQCGIKSFAVGILGMIDNVCGNTCSFGTRQAFYIRFVTDHATDGRINSLISTLINNRLKVATAT